MLQELGWSKDDYNTGIREEAVTAAFHEYEDLLKEELADGRAPEDAKAKLRRFRTQAAIDPQVT